MTDPTALIQNIATSRTTTKILCIMLIGMAAGYLFKSGNILAVTVTSIIIAAAAIALLSVSYIESKHKQMPDPKPYNIRKENWIVIDNLVLTFLLFTFLAKLL